MEDEILSSALHVDNAKSAAVFLTPSSRTMLAYLAHPRCASDVAIHCKMPLNLACYHLGRLVSLDLVSVEGHLPRPGRPMKQYRARATSFYIPAQFAGRTLGAQLSEELRNLLEDGDAFRQGELFFMDEKGRMRARKVPEEGRSCVSTNLEFWAETRLSAGDVAAFADELRELIKRYARPDGRGARFLLHAALARRKGSVPVG